MVFSGLALSQIAAAIASVSWLGWGCLSGAEFAELQQQDSGDRRLHGQPCPLKEKSTA
jgi:hypothetical protein|tara:strand:+ start:531 stop:704 length:174 start_codon:yes stop_codon:yes gene_type:complete